MALRIGIDVDDTLREFMSILGPIMLKEFPGCMNETTLPTWGFTDYKLPTYDISYMWKEKYIKELIIDSPPCQNAIEGFNDLRTWADISGHKLICVTNQSPETNTPTIEWLGKHRFRFDEIHIVSDKTDVELDYLIDDSPRYYDQWIVNGNSKNKFIMINQPYNKQIYHNVRADSMLDVKQIILNTIS